MGLMLYLMQVGPLAVFLMNGDKRKTYRMGQMGIQLNSLFNQIEQIKKAQNANKNSNSSK